MSRDAGTSGRVRTDAGRWSNRYAVGGYSEVYESRFATGELSISAEAFLAEWPTWNESEQFDFVRAFALKLTVSAEDERIIEFLISQPDERLREMIASMAARHSNRDLALEFLLAQASTARLKRENFLQALGLIRDPRALPRLRSFYAEDMAEVTAAPDRISPELARDLVLCCEALENTPGSGTGWATLKDLKQHSNEQIRSVANLRDTIRKAAAEDNDRAEFE
jgi:hypothetical protein